MGNKSTPSHSEEFESHRRMSTDFKRSSEFMRRKAAGDYLKDKYGFGSEKTLAKLACIGGGPAFHKAGDKVVIYTQESLDAWALAKISGPLRSTSESVPA